MQKLFYVSHDNEDIGPFSIEEIDSKFKKKELGIEDYVYVEAVEDWVLIQDFLKKNVPASAPKITPPPLQKTTPVSTSFKKEDTGTITHTNTMIDQPTKSSIPVTDLKKEEGSVRFTHGEAKVSVRHEKAGKVHVEIDGGKLGLKVEGATEIVFVAGPAASVSIEGPHEVQVGVPAKLTFKALDKFGNLDTHFDGKIKINSLQKVEGTGEVHFKSGVAQKEIKGTKAESVDITMSPISHASLDLKKNHKIHLKAGKAAKILVESPKEARAGEEAFINVKAVDQYGNLDPSFHDVVTVRLSGSIEGHTQIKLNGGSGSIKVG